jgi:hypothetical protein
MLVEESTIEWKVQLAPLATMPFGIVCTLTPDCEDEHGVLQDRLAIRIPLWDEDDVDLCSASLSKSGHGIILSMPATASYLMKPGTLKEMDRQIGLDDTKHEELAMFYNQITMEHMQAARIVKVLLLFPEGQTFHNKSFNEAVRAPNDLSLERQSCIFQELTKEGNLQATRVSVGFSVAMDKKGGTLEVGTDCEEQTTAPPTDGTTDLLV